MKTLSLDIRKRILACYDEREHTREAIAKRFCVSLGMVKKLGERHRRRLKLVRLEYDYLVRLMEVIRRYGTFRGNPCQDTVRPLLDAIDGRNAFLDRLCDPKTGHVRIFDTWPELRLFGYASRDLLRHNGRSAGKIEEPLAWNTADVRAAYDVDAWRKGLEARTGIQLHWPDNSFPMLARWILRDRAIQSTSKAQIWQ